MIFLIKISEFFRKIRSSSESVRRRWLIVFTSGSIVAVIGLWLIYMNALVEPVIQRETVVMASAEEAGVADTFAAGIKTIARGGAALVGGALESLREVINASRTVTVDRAERNFIIEDLEPIPETQLP